MTHSGNFEVRRSDIMRVLDFGEKKTRNAISDAKASGYLKTITERNEKGHLTSRYIVSTDGTFTASGEGTSLRTPIELPKLTQFEKDFVKAFPSQVEDWSKFRNLLSKAQCRHGIEKVISWAEGYTQEVNNRSRGGRISKPENYLWRKLNPDYGAVLEEETETANHETPFDMEA